MNSIAIWFASTLGKHISAEAVVFIVSMIPILELRGGLLVAPMLEIPIWTAIPLCVVGNMLPIPFILLFIKRIFAFLKRFSFTGKIVDKLEKRAENKSGSIKNAEFWGLAIFVGIPLPGTGAWTGSLIASLLDIDFWKAIIAIFLGVVMATVIMALIGYGIIGNII